MTGRLTTNQLTTRMKKNALLYPRFLQKIDLYLVKKYPLIWSIRAHYFLYYSLLSCLVLGGLAMITPIGMADLDHHSNYVSISISSILAVTVACFWIYKTVIFDKQRQFGQRKITDEYISFILSFITLVGMWFIIFSYAGALEFKRTNIVSDKELIEDVNTANLAQLFMLETRSYNSSESNTLTDEERVEISKDSAIKIKNIALKYNLTLNSNYVFFTNYNLIKYKNRYNSYEHNYNNNEEVSELIDGIDNADKIKAKASKIKTVSEVHALLQNITDLTIKYDIYGHDDNNSYHNPDNNSINHLTFNDLKNQYDDIMKTRALLQEQAAEKEGAEFSTAENLSKTRMMQEDVKNFTHSLDRRFSEISYLKYSKHGFFGKDSLMFSGYFLLAICILLHMFKNVRWKQFIIFIVVACLLPIIYAIFGFIFANNDNAKWYGEFCYYATFFYGVVHIFLAYDRKSYNLWNIIGVMIFNAMVLTVPLFTFFFLEFKLFHNNENFDYMMYMIQIIETIFYVVFMLPMMKRIYERLYALPRN